MPQLVLEIDGQYRTLEPGQSYTIGRDPQSDFTFDDARVSWRHATISFTGAAWQLQDHGSTNGTYLAGGRVQTTQLAPGAVLNLGNAENGPRLSFTAPVGAPAATPANAGAGAGAWHEAETNRNYAAPPAPVPAGTAAAAVGRAAATGLPRHPAATGRPGTAVPARAGRAQPDDDPQPHRGMRTIRIGRALDNDIVVSDLQVSRHHAELRQLQDGRYEIVDLGSHNGIFVNGQPVQRQLLGPQDRLTVGHSSFQLVGDQLQEFIDNGTVSFSAHHLTVEVDHKGGKKVLLNDVSFGVPEKSLVAVIGPSGSGKSTLLRALTGYRPADAAMCSTTAATSTSSSPNCASGSAWCRSRRSCTRS